MRTGVVAAVLIGALALASCSEPPVEQPAGAAGTVTHAAVPAVGLEAADLRTVDLGPAKPRATVRVDVAPGEQSFLYSAQADDLDAELAIDDVTGPDGESVVPEASLLDNPGEVSVLVVGSGGTLRPGPYEVHLANGVTTRGRATFKRPTPGVQAVDVRIWDATRKGTVSDAAGTAKVERVLRERGTEAFAPVGLRVGSISFSRAPATVVTRFAKLRLPSDGNERNLRELCLGMREALGADRAVDLVAVDRIADKKDRDSELFGSAAAIPGATFVPDASTGCVAVAVGGDGGIGAQASTVWHETGHLLGLFHTTEDDGTEFDPIDDTPRCTEDRDEDDDGYVDADECEALDGQNLMFNDTEGVEVTPGQAAVLRAHPLFHP